MNGSDEATGTDSVPIVWYAPHWGGNGKGGVMSRKAYTGIGVWIDHRKAVLVHVGQGDPEAQTVRSGVSVKDQADGVPPQDTPEDSSRSQLEKYYRKILRGLRDAQVVFLFGPGEAKLELKRMLLRSRTLAGKLVGLETTEAMTDEQIVARVREVFKQHTP